MTLSHNTIHAHTIITTIEQCVVYYVLAGQLNYSIWFFILATTRHWLRNCVRFALFRAVYPGWSAVSEPWNFCDSVCLSRFGWCAALVIIKKKCHNLEWKKKIRFRVSFNSKKIISRRLLDFSEPRQFKVNTRIDWRAPGFFLCIKYFGSYIRTSLACRFDIFIGQQPHWKRNIRTRFSHVRYKLRNVCRK